MAILTLRDILRGQTTLDTIILRRRNVSAKSPPFKYVFVPTSYLSPPLPSPPAHGTPGDTRTTTSSASASGVQPNITPSLAPASTPAPAKNNEPNVASTPVETSRSPSSLPNGYLCHVLPHERLYDLGRRENWRRMMNMSLFDTWSHGRYVRQTLRLSTYFLFLLMIRW